MPHRTRTELALPGRAASVPAARRFVKATLASWQLLHLQDSAALVVTELTTNAVLHARTDLVVRLTTDGLGSLRIEVVDAAARLPRQKGYSETAASGRGLGMVTTVASKWGISPAEGGQPGKIVWADLAGGA